MKSGYLFIMLLLILAIRVISGCGDCKDCGPSQSYPYFKIRFFNIDSLNKVNASIATTQDSFNIISQLIDSGHVEYDTLLIELQNELNFLENIQTNIRMGKIKIDEVEGTGTDKILLFRDSLTNDSLISFNFPLSMAEDKSEFIVHIAGRKDTLAVRYQLITKSGGHTILRRAYGINIVKSTYDSLKVFCKSDTCLSNETTLYAYF